MEKTLIALGMSAILLLGAGYALADEHTKGESHSGTHQHESIGPAKDLNLTPEQKAKFKELRWKFDEETAQLKGWLLTKRLELQSLWRNPKSDSKAIMDKEKELRDVQNQIKDKTLQYTLEARKSLTPEQIEEMGPGWGRAFGFGRRHRMGEDRGMGQGMGHGMMGPGMGHGMMGPGMGRGMGPGMGMCN